MFIFRLVKLFRDPVTKLYCLFVQAVIPTFDIFNKYLQSEEPLVHLFYQSTSKLLHSLLSRVVLPEVISAADDLLEIDLEDSSNLRDSNVIFIGMTTKQYARSNDMIGTYVYKKFLKECKDFYIKCGTYLQKSVPVLKDEVLRSLTFIRLPERHLASQEELDIILQRFPTVVDEAQLDDLQTQFLDYQAMSDASLPHDSDKDGKKIRIDAVWRDIAAIKDPYSGLPRFPVLVQLVRVLLLIPHSNAYCESVFSTVRKICTDGRHNLGKNTTQGHGASSAYNDTAEIRNTLVGVLVTKTSSKEEKLLAINGNLQIKSYKKISP